MMLTELMTPFEQGNQNQTTTLGECMAFYKMLEQRFPKILRMFEIGKSDGGTPIWAGLITSDGLHDFHEIKRACRPIFFNNNGIHPGEPEGVDSCMALVRDFCVQPALLSALKKTVFLFIPVYNVDGCLRRNNSSRVNQLGPEQFGFRGNALHLDLNRDFIKCDSLAAQAFNRFFTFWDPDVMVDTHTSNGADYSYTMTVIATQPDKIGGGIGAFIRDMMMPEIAGNMAKRGWPICPYVNPVREIPDDGIEDFLDLPRFSTGYAALHHTIGLMPETHMLKHYADRYAAMRAFVEEMLWFSVTFSDQIQALRIATNHLNNEKEFWPVRWTVARDQPAKFLFRGYEARYRPSVLGNYERLYYSNEPFEKEIDYFNRYRPVDSISAPDFYVVPQQWRDVLQRLEWNGVQMDVATTTQSRMVQTYHIKRVKSRPQPYEGRMFHDEVELALHTEMVTVHAGDYFIPVRQDRIRYAIETLEPLAHDSFFRWGFFNSILEKKETYSNYIFEDTASELLENDPELARKFEDWKARHPELLADQQAVLDFIFFNCQAYQEPEWCRYPIWRVVSPK